MPLTRYQIRNEYSLADPELYLAADKDDPEALLEGVAMAGLVGVLRQLGDLAEFAAEVFHDLHEEVMATAARGHGLMARVQQLEAEVPSIEKAFLSQTNHSSLYDNAGVDWHPNLRMDQNLITQGDLPRFVMDSYEECRGPPRLFILDKFDVAGAGACLKRYTNPSFFKVEAAFSRTPNVEIQRDRKIRKVKKKGARGRHGETPEVLPTSNVKLHQLFLEERVENGSTDPARLVKLKKRQLNGSPFDFQTKKSYMQKLLQTSSPEHRVVHEISTSPPPFKLSSNSIESGPKILDIQTVNFAAESLERSRSKFVYPIPREPVLQPSMDELSDEVIGGVTLKVPTLDLDREMDEISSRPHEVVAEKELAVDRESKVEGSANGSPSDDVASETDSFMDALNTLESEIETDTECRPKNDLGFFNVKNHGRDSDANEEQRELQAQFSDSQSIGYSNASDDGNNSFKMGTSIFSYSDRSCLAENTPSDGDGAAEVFPSTENRVVESVDTSSDKLSISDGILRTKSHEHSLPNGICTEAVDAPNLWAECGETYDISNCTNSNPTLLPLGLEACSREVSSVVSEQDVTFSDSNEFGTGIVNTDTNRKNTGDILPATDNFSDISSLKNIVPTESLSADDLDDVDPNVFTDALLNLSSDSDLAPEKNSRGIGDNEVLHAGNADDTSHKISPSDSSVHLPSDSDPQPEKNCRENVVDEVLHSEYADDASIENIINKNIGSPLLNVLSTEKQLLSSNFPEVELPSVITIQPNYLPASTTHCSDAENPDDIVSEVDAIPAAVANSVADSPQSSSFSEQKLSERTDSFPTHKTISAEVGRLHSGERPDHDGLCNTKDFEEIDGSTSSKDGTESDLVSSQVSSEYPNHASPEDQIHKENMVAGTIQAETEDVMVAATAAKIVDDSDANHLSQDIPCSSSRNSMNMQESLSTFGVSHQKGFDIHELSPPECLIESDAQEEVNQSAVGPGNADSMSVGVPGLSVNVKSLNSLPNDDATKRPTFSKQKNQPTEFLSDISDPSQIDKDQNSFLTHDFTSSPRSAKEKEQDIGSDSPHLTHFSDNSESAGSLPTSYLPDPGNQFERAMELQADQLDVECVHANNTIPRLLILHSEQIPDSNHIPQERCFSASMESSLEGLPGQASISESSLQSAGIKLESSDQAMAPSMPIFPSLGLFPQASQVSLEEIPPLPPLPPMQWRIGNASLARQSFQEHSLGSVPPILPSRAAENAQFGFLASPEIEQPQNPILPPSDVKDENSQQIFEHLASPSPFSLQIPTMVSGAYNQQNLLTLGDGTESLNSCLPLPVMPEMPQDGFIALDGERTQPTSNPSSTEPPVEIATTLHAPISLPENLILPPIEQVLETDLEDKKFTDTSQNLEGENENNSLEFLPPPIVEDQQHQPGLQIPGEMAWSSNSSGLLPASENGKPNGDTSTKVPRPRNPLIDAVAAHDKSKLRKVTERARPQIEHKVDERDSMLEQIRAKSFNLKPAVMTRPSIQGPKTNLKMAAILEKANAIRQALAGSDEDDEDNWSDD